MDNKVVQTLARAFVQCGWTSVRFNFRGVGASAGEHDAGQGEAQDLLAVVQQVAPEGRLALAGFSFGAFVTSHALAALWHEGRVREGGAGGHGGQPLRTSAPVPPRRTSAPWWCMARRTTPCLCSRDGLGAPADTACNRGARMAGHFFHGQLPLLKGLVVRHLAADR